MDVVVVSLGPCSGNVVFLLFVIGPKHQTVILISANLRKTWKPFKTTRDLVTARTRDGAQHTLTTVTPLLGVPTEKQNENGSGEDVYREPDEPEAEVDESRNELGELRPDKEPSTGSASESSSLRLSQKGGLVGDTCSKDSDCSALEHGFCVEHIGHKICLCRRGYVPSQNRSRCVAVSNQIEPCAQQPYPCQNGGSCVDDDTQPMIGFRCICPRGYAGFKCEKKAESKALRFAAGC